MRKDGTVLYLWSKPSRFTVDGKTVGFQAVIVDVTRFKETERKLAETNKNFEMLLETAMEGIAIIDPDENLTFANRAFTNIVGYKERELLGLNVRKLADEKSLQEIRSAVEKKGGVSRYEFVIRRKDGEPRFVQVSAAPLLDKNRTYMSTMAIVVDITEQKKMKEKMRESEERLKKLIEYAPDTIFVMDLNGTFMDGNKQAEILTGYKRKELVGKNMFEMGLLSEKSLKKAAEDLKRNMRGEKTGPHEFELIRKDGTMVFTETSSFPVTRGGSVEVIGVTRDITKRKKWKRH